MSTPKKMIFFTLSSHLLLFLLISTMPIDYLPEILINSNKNFLFFRLHVKVFMV